jgi:NAD(P)-dependent dehydrogenase (short-subunit alcohol dehydrogenase family)
MLLGKRVVIVAGGAGGLGRGIGAMCAQHGAHCVLADINSDAVERTVHELGPAAVPFTCDVSIPSQLADLIGYCVDQFGRLDGVWSTTLESTLANRSWRQQQMSGTA